MDQQPALRLCAHCLGANAERFFAHREQETLRCRACGGFFNRPGHDTDAMYDEPYYARNYVPRRAAQLDGCRKHVDALRRFVSSGSMLDYGCGTGMLLRAAAEAGFVRNVGADVSPAALKLASEAAGPDLETVKLPDESLPERRFEVIALMDSISHLARPRETIALLLHRHLARDGVVVVRTPDVAPAYFERIRACRLLLGAAATSSLMFARARYVIFDAESLPRYLGSLGLEVRHLERFKEPNPPLPLRSPAAAAKEVVFRALTATNRTLFTISDLRR